MTNLGVEMQVPAGSRGFCTHHCNTWVSDGTERAVSRRGMVFDGTRQQVESPYLCFDILCTHWRCVSYTRTVMVVSKIRIDE